MTSPTNCQHRQWMYDPDHTVVVGREVIVAYLCTDCGEMQTDAQRLQLRIWLVEE